LDNYSTSTPDTQLFEIVNGTFASGTWYAQAILNYAENGLNCDTGICLLSTSTVDYSQKFLTFSPMISFNVSSTMASSSYINNSFTNGVFSAGITRKNDNCASITSNNFSVWSPHDWYCVVAGGIDSISNNISNATQSSFQTIYSLLNQVFPFSLVTSFNNDVIAAKTNFDNNVSSTATISLGNGNPNVFQGHTFILYSSSTKDFFQAKLGWDFRGFATKLIYFFTGMMSILLAIKFILMVHGSNQPSQ
jgi:hypothetical protein